MSDARTTEEKSGFRPSPKLVVSVVAAILVVVFALQNRADKNVQFYFWDVQSPLWLWFLIVLVIGVVIGLLLPYGRKKD